MVCFVTNTPSLYFTSSEESKDDRISHVDKPELCSTTTTVFIITGDGSILRGTVVEKSD